MQLRDLEDLRKIFKRITAKIVGIGITAFSKISLAYFVPDYRIFCLKNTSDLSILRELADITCLGEMDESVNYIESTSMDILSSKEVQKKLFDSKTTHLYVYQSYFNMETLLKDKNVLPIANKAVLREKISSKAFFVKLLEELKIRQLQYEIISLNDFLNEKPSSFFYRFRGPFVVQSLQIKKGGGRGVFFIMTIKDLLAVREVVAKGRLHNTSLEAFLLRPYVNSIPMSMLGCVTPLGVIAGPIQYQLIDLYGPTKMGERGIFCGHSWTEDTEKSLMDQAVGLVKKVGQALRHMGYSGIYGVDFLWDGQELYPLELNPRITGALPVLTLLQLEKKLVPLELIHILSFVEPNISYNLSSLEEALLRGVRGAQILLFYDDLDSQISSKLKAGHYLWDGSKAIYVGAPLGLLPRGDREFSVMDGPLNIPDGVKLRAKSFFRMARILFKNPVLDDNGNLLEWVKDLLKWVKGENLGGDKRTLSSNHHSTACFKQGSGEDQASHCT